MRCLEPAAPVFDGRRPRGPPARRRRRAAAPPYVDEDDDLDLRGWARDALALALPGPDHLPPDCAGLCPRCGANLNEEPDHAPRGRAGPALGEAVRAEVRLGRAGVRYPSAPPWPSRSRSSRTRAPTSAARSTRSPRRRSTPARSATSRAVRTACARTAGSTAGARSSHVHEHARPRSRATDRPGHRRGRRERGRPRSRRGRARGRRRRRRGRRARAAVRARRRDRRRRRGRRGDRRAGLDRQGPPTRRARCARTPDASIVARRARPSPTGEADALVSGGSTGAALAAVAVPLQARARASTGRRWRSLVPVPGAPFLLLDAGANVEVRPEHLVQFAHMGAAFMEAVMGVARPRVALLSNGEEPIEGPRERRRRPRGAARPARRAELRRQRRGLRDRHRRRRRDRRRRLHRQRRAEGDGGHVGGAAGRGPRARRCRRTRSKLGGLLLRPALRELRDELDPQEQGGAVLLGPAQARRRAARLVRARAGSRARSRLAARGVREDVVGPHARAPRRAGALRRAAEASEAVASVPDQP